MHLNAAFARKGAEGRELLFGSRFQLDPTSLWHSLVPIQTSTSTRRGWLFVPQEWLSAAEIKCLPTLTGRGDNQLHQRPHTQARGTNELRPTRLLPSAATAISCHCCSLLLLPVALRLQQSCGITGQRSRRGTAVLQLFRNDTLKHVIFRGQRGKGPAKSTQGSPFWCLLHF